MSAADIAMSRLAPTEKLEAMTAGIFPDERGLDLLPLLGGEPGRPRDVGDRALGDRV